MVDELSVGLAELGQDVYVISPYYDKNRKGVSGYLANDPDSIQWSFNVETKLAGQNTVFGIHEGVVNGVKVAFIHNAEIFPKIY